MVFKVFQCRYTNYGFWQKYSVVYFQIDVACTSLCYSLLLRVSGTIHIEKGLYGRYESFEPGLLAKANRDNLYVDEINLLDDHLVDLLLDLVDSSWTG